MSALPIDFIGIKALATELRRPAGTLYALAAANDPFYCGAPAQARDAEWFADIWARFGFRHGAHLRRVHYVLVSQEEAVRLPSGAAYENTVESWLALNAASKAARYLGLVPIEALVDRRNPDPILNLKSGTRGEIDIGSGSLWELSMPEDLPELPSIILKRPRAAQRYHLEIWIEKSTVADVLEPLASSYGANLVTFLGESSVTACHRAFERIRQSERPARILYVSDFDPAGQSMPVAAARKIEFSNYRAGAPLDVQLHPLVLTEDQCEHYRLPRTPIKSTEKRAARFEERFGSGATELDALEALYPGELRKIIKAELDRYYDHDLDRREAEVAAQARDELDDIELSVLEDHQHRIGELGVRYAELREQVEAFRTDAESTWHAIAESLGAAAPDIEDFDWPEPDEGNERARPLFDSTRGYVDQVDAYKEFQGKPTKRKPRTRKGVRS